MLFLQIIFSSRNLFTLTGHGHDIKPRDLIPEHGWKMLEKNIYEKGLKKLTEMFLKLKTTDSGSHLKEIESALKTLAMARKEQLAIPTDQHHQLRSVIKTYLPHQSNDASFIYHLYIIISSILLKLHKYIKIKNNGYLMFSFLIFLSVLMHVLNQCFT